MAHRGAGMHVARWRLLAATSGGHDLRRLIRTRTGRGQEDRHALQVAGWPDRRSRSTDLGVGSRHRERRGVCAGVRAGARQRRARRAVRHGRCDPHRTRRARRRSRAGRLAELAGRGGLRERRWPGAVLPERLDQRGSFRSVPRARRHPRGAHVSRRRPRCLRLAHRGPSVQSPRVGVHAAIPKGARSTTRARDRHSASSGSSTPSTAAWAGLPVPWAGPGRRASPCWRTAAVTRRRSRTPSSTPGRVVPSS